MEATAENNLKSDGGAVWKSPNIIFTLVSVKKNTNSCGQ